MTPTTTGTRSRLTHGEITRAQWCARDVRDPETRRVSHRVDLTQAARPGGIRDALCGRAATKWRPTVEFDPPTGQATCPECADLSATADKTAAPRTVSGPARGAAPTTHDDPIARTPARPADTNAAGARVAARVAYRDSWRPRDTTT